MIDVEQTIIAQYANSPILLGLINGMNSCIDPTVNLNNFFNQIRNVLTAQGYGLDVWGRIVGVKRTITIPVVPDNFGFQEGNFWQPFGPGGIAPFSNGSLPGSTIYSLTDDAFRTLILAKALANISACSIQAINQLLSNLFGSVSRCYVIDNQNMTMTVVSEAPLSQINVNILTQSNIIPRPCGVLVHLLNGFSPETTFGFRGTGLASFGAGTFFAGGYRTIAI